MFNSLENVVKLFFSNCNRVFKNISAVFTDYKCNILYNFTFVKMFSESSKHNTCIYNNKIRLKSLE